MATNDSHAALAAALAARAEAAAKHTADAEALDRGKERLAAAQAEVQRLSAEDDQAVARHARRLETAARENSTRPVPDLVPSDRHVAQQIAASRTHAAAVQAVQSLEVVAQRSAEELAAADAAVRKAAREAVRAEVRADFDELQRLNARRRELREKLLGGYLADPGALPDREWSKVDETGDHSAQTMDIGMPLVGVSIYAAGAMGGDWRAARGRINAAEQRYHERVAELERGEGVDATDTQANAA